MRFLKILPGIVLTVFITMGNVSAFRPAAMRSFSVIGIVLMSLVAVLRRRAGGFSAIDWGFFIFMTMNGIAFWVFPQTMGRVMADFPTGMLYVVLFLTAAAPAALMNRYFTEHFAKQTTPEAVWDTDIFKTINRHMTWLWAALFVGSALVTAIPYIFDIPGSLFTGMLFQIILPGILMASVGIPLNRKYPRYYQRKTGIEPADLDRSQAAPATAVLTDADNRLQKEEKMDGRLKVVALNGSPHGAIGNISQMIQMVASALSQEDILVEEVHLSEKRVEYCVGCAICLQNGKCWRPDDYVDVVEKLLTADGIILASPVYFGHVTAQMKAFIDRSLAYGHKPRLTWKPGLALSVSAGRGETETAHYLARTLGVYGSFSVGTFTAIATNPGAFLGKEMIDARARDLARDLARAMREKRRYPLTDEHLSMFLFMKELVTREKDFMEDDYRYWQQTGLLEGFEAYAGQQFSTANFDPELRKEWLREITMEDKTRSKGLREKREEAGSAKGDAGGHATGKASAKTCLELIKMMPLGFKKGAAQGLAAVYQFEITGQEEFSAYLKIAGDQCTFHEGRYGKPDVVIRSPADVWLAISRGEMNGQTAFMSGKYKMEGNVGLVMKLKGLFG
jgi:multimeric flavodoxin WrbA/putative sterol carrier protein